VNGYKTGALDSITHWASALMTLVS
jgi:hypothetical protein